MQFKMLKLSELSQNDLFKMGCFVRPRAAIEISPENKEESAFLQVLLQDYSALGQYPPNPGERRSYIGQIGDKFVHVFSH